MDRTGIIVITLCAILFGVWVFEQNKFAQQQAQYAATHPVVITNSTSATASSTTNPSSPLDNATNPSSVQTGVVALTPPRRNI